MSDPLPPTPSNRQVDPQPPSAIQALYDRRVAQILGNSPANTENGQTNDPEAARRSLALMFKAIPATRKEIDKILRQSFQGFLAELETKATKLALLDKSSVEYKQQFHALATEFESRVVEFNDTSNSERVKTKAEICTQLLSDLLTSRFSETAIDDPVNILIATLVLRTNQGIIVDLIKNYLAADQDDKTAKNFLATTQSARLSEDPIIFKSLFHASVDGIEDYESKEKKRITENLIDLSPGSNPNSKGQYLLQYSLEQEQNLLDEYKLLFSQLSNLDEDNDDDYSVATIGIEDTDEGLQEGLEEKIGALKTDTIIIRNLIDQLYNSPEIHPILSGQEALDQLDQTNPIQTQDDFIHLLDEVYDENIANLFDTNLLKSTLTTAIQFAKANPSKLKIEQVKNKLEEVINQLDEFTNKLDNYPSFYLMQLTTAIELYSKHFAPDRPNDFLMNLAINPETSDVLKCIVVQTIADSKVFTVRLKRDFNQGQLDSLSTLFAAANNTKKLFEPLKTFLSNLNYQDFTRCINELRGKASLEIDKNNQIVSRGTFNNENILSIIANQFKWEDAKDPISINLVQYIEESLNNEKLREGDTKIAQFIKFIIDNNDNPKDETPAPDFQI